MDAKTQCYAALNILTRIRFCDCHAEMDTAYTGPPGSQPSHLKPWFDWPHQRQPNYTLVFGHWASLGFMKRPGLLALDTGCVWGRELTAYCFDPGGEQRISVSCANIVSRQATIS